MTKFSNVVRFKVKADHAAGFGAHFSGSEKWDGLISQFLIQTGDQTFCAVALWESEAALVAARPQMIAFLDTIRDKLEELPGDLGVTDAVSGQVVVET